MSQQRWRDAAQLSASIAQRVSQASPDDPTQPDAMTDGAKIFDLFVRFILLGIFISCCTT